VDLGEDRPVAVGEHGDLEETSGHELLEQGLAVGGADLSRASRGLGRSCGHDRV